MKEFVCIMCPRGCQLKFDDNGNVTGNGCPRGKEYAISEMTNPTRVVTSSIRVINREHTLVSVKTSIPVPKALMFEVMKEIEKIFVSAPTKIGQVVKSNILRTGADIVITKVIK